MVGACLYFSIPEACLANRLDAPEDHLSKYDLEDLLSRITIDKRWDQQEEAACRCHVLEPISLTSSH